MTQGELLKKFSGVEKIATASKLRRMLLNPARYIYAIGFRELIYRILKKPLLKKTKLFTGDVFYVKLPAGTDILITGGKSDDSELRLTKFIIKNLKEGDCFLDIGAHFGFYSVLASKSAGKDGKVYSFEGSGNNYEVLKKNIQGCPNIESFHTIVCDKEGIMMIYEFPTAYSEFNSIYPAQYNDQSWYKEAKTRSSDTNSITLNKFFDDHKIKPAIIKIDVEGSEYDVVKGGDHCLPGLSGVYIVMEYLAGARNSENHRKAAQFLTSMGFKSFVIGKDGTTKLCDDIDKYLEENNFEGDNIVFNK